MKGNLCRCTGYHAIEEAILGITRAGHYWPGHSAGINLGNPLAESIATGRARYTADFEIDALLHLKVLRSPHAHARIKAIRKDKALAVPGVHAVFTWEDVPACSTVQEHTPIIGPIQTIPTSSTMLCALSDNASSPSSRKPKELPMRPGQLWARGMSR